MIGQFVYDLRPTTHCSGGLTPKSHGAEIFSGTERAEPTRPITAIPFLFRRFFYFPNVPWSGISGNKSGGMIKKIAFLCYFQYL